MSTEREPTPQPDSEPRKFKLSEAQNRAEKQTEYARRSAAIRESFFKLRLDEQFVLIFPPDRPDDPEYQARWEQAQERVEGLFNQLLKRESLKVDRTDYQNAEAYLNRVDRAKGEGTNDG